jgi:hypothetical protein
MIEASRVVVADLLADAPLQAVINGGNFWELAPDNAKVPFVTFRIVERPRRTKDGREDYDLQVRCFDDTLTKAAELSGLAKTALKEANYRYLGGRSGYTDTEAQEGFVELNFNFNL